MEESKKTQKLLDAAEKSVEKPNIIAPPTSSSTDADGIQESHAKASVSAADNKSKKPVDSEKRRNQPRKKQKSTKSLLIGLLIKIAVIVLVIWGLFTFVLGVTIHYGNNMHPMVRDGDLVFSLRLQKPYINAAVLYGYEGKTTVGRVIALEGSVVDITEGGAFTVNGNTPSEEIFYPTFPASGSGISYPYTVPAGEVFILNDFREDTLDSRSFGAVPVGDLKGTLLLTVRRRGF